MEDLSDYSESFSNSENEDLAVSSVDHYAEIDRMLDVYENAAKQEDHFLLCTPYSLGGLEIRCGLSPTRTFSPAIMLYTNRWQKMTFGSYEWALFTDLLQKTLEGFFDTSDLGPNQYLDNYEPVTSRCGDFTTVTQNIFEDVKFLKVVKLGTSIELYSEDVREILRSHNNIISHNIITLERLDFSVYFHNLLSIVKPWLNEFGGAIGIDMLKLICDSSNGSFLSSALREYLYYYKDDVIKELNK